MATLAKGPGIVGIKWRFVVLYRGICSLPYIHLLHPRFLQAKSACCRVQRLAAFNVDRNKWQESCTHETSISKCCAAISSVLHRTQRNNVFPICIYYMLSSLGLCVFRCITARYCKKPACFLHGRVCNLLIPIAVWRLALSHWPVSIV